MPSTAPSLLVVAGAIHDASGRVLIAQRPDHAHLGGLWEFPGGKVEPGETALAALVRELDEELGIQVTAARPLIEVPHHYPERSIRLKVYTVTAYQSTPQSREHQPLAWQFPAEMDPAQFPPADHAVIRALQLPACYFITPDSSTDLIPRLEQALLAGAELVQLRAHSLDDAAYVQLAAAVADCCAVHEIPLVFNRAPELSPQLPASAGWHLTTAALHQLSSRDALLRTLIGASCHNAADLERAGALRLDYALLSPVQPTATHPDQPALGWESFAHLTAQAILPVYALGGLGPEDLATAWAHGAQGIAAMRGLS